MHEMKNMDEHNHDIDQKIYTCSMHPEIIRYKPGKCPICGMELVEKMMDGESTNESKLEILLKPTNAFVLSQTKTITAKQNQFPIEIDATGKITYDTKELSVVSSRVEGRIEKLYVKYLFQPVKIGQKLMDIYSKELVTEQENYLFVLNNDSENEDLLKIAENRLLLQGLTKNQLIQIKNTRIPIQFVSVYSPFSGQLYEMIDEDNSLDMSNMSYNQPSNLTIHEGMYVLKGQRIFTIYNTKKVWAVLNIDPDKMNLVKKNQKVKLKINSENEIIGNHKIDFIEPEIRIGQNTISIRVNLSNNENKIKIGSNLSAIIEVGNKTGLFIPSTSIIQLGDQVIVFIKDKELFRAQKIQTGIKTNDFVEIISGLNENENIAENAQLLMDSESFIKSENY